MSMRRKNLVIVLALLTAAISASAAEFQMGRFSSGDLSGWESQIFKGKKETAYSLVKENGRTVLQAQSRHAASGLIHKVTLDPKEYPLLRWSWKVEHALRREDVTKKSGD